MSTPTEQLTELAEKLRKIYVVAEQELRVKVDQCNKMVARCGVKAIDKEPFLTEVTIQKRSAVYSKYHWCVDRDRITRRIELRVSCTDEGAGSVYLDLYELPKEFAPKALERLDAFLEHYTEMAHMHLDDLEKATK